MFLRSENTKFPVASEIAIVLISCQCNNNFQIFVHQRKKTIICPSGSAILQKSNYRFSCYEELIVTHVCFPCPWFSISSCGSLKGLSDCRVSDWPMDAWFEPVEGKVVVQGVQARAQLCCRNRRQCTLCLAVELQIHIPPQPDTSEDHGGGGRPTNGQRRELSPYLWIGIEINQLSTTCTIKQTVQR